MPFPSDFLWGAATAAYQIEGAAKADGRGDSVWDMVCRRPGFVKRGDTGDVACDHYNRWREDVGIMREIGLKAYRFSIAWPRVLPLGDGPVNEKGLAFYDRLVDALLEAGIRPMATLFHWDYPTALFNRGGWLNPRSPEWFADYARVVVDRLSDRVVDWMTLNEPQCFIGLGLENGHHAPGLQLPIDQVLLAAHHSNLAHGRAVRVIREHARRAPRIGWAPVGVADFPDDPDNPADVEAARRRMFSVAAMPLDPVKMFNNVAFSDPVCLGEYPDEYYRAFGDAAVRPPRHELETISEPIDFFGFNLYQGARVKAGPDGEPRLVPEPVGAPKTTMGWPITPEALYWATRFYHERYGRPILITENGRAVSDYVSEDGRVHDDQRIDYLRMYLRALGRAVDEGIPVLGYCLWSLLDNFEWAWGYEQRFGIVHVDYRTQKRTLKDSARWYAEVIRTNGAILSEAGAAVVA